MATVLIDINDLIHVVDNDVVKKDVYCQLVKKVNVLDTCKLANKTDYNAKSKDIEDKIPNITNLATTVALTSVRNNIPNVSTLV